MKIRNSNNYDYKEIINEKNKGIGQTIPDQNMSVREILQRHSRGMSLGAIKTPIFDIDDDTPDIRTLDLSERAEYAQYAKDEIKRIKTAHEKTTALP
jgi:hypothetical protein